jgi:thiol-disulfide isomerase/thioredoxin
MKKILVSIVSLFFVIALHAQDLPETEIKDVNTGKKMAFNSIPEKGKVTIISFWATWCIPCKKEIKNISLKLNDWHKEADFNYMTISVDKVEAEGLVRSYAISQGWKFPYFIDANSDLMRSLSFQNVPYTMILDKNGKVAFTHSGYEEGGETDVWAKVKELAAAK